MTRPAPHDPAATVRLACEEDLPAIGDAMAGAFAGDPVESWLVRDDPDDRRRIMPTYFAMLAGLGLESGRVYVAPAPGIDRLDAVAVWMDASEAGPPPPPHPDPRTVRLCGRHADRFHALDLALHGAHEGLPPHQHLWFLAVRPESQGKGIGAALLAVHHRVLDAAGTPAYLDASSPRSRQLYLRHRYRDIREPFFLPDGGPVSFPMWRDPRRPPLDPPPLSG